MNELHVIITEEDEISMQLNGNPERVAVALMNCMLQDERIAAICQAAVEGFIEEQ